MKNFAEAVNLNYEQPEHIYDFLDLDYQDAFSESQFIEAFTKERSYPYLTPLWINYKQIEMAPGNLSGIAFFFFAARMKGMTYEVPTVYQNFRYRMIAFTDFPDSSYLDKFDHIPNYLINGWD